jgi:hypothetical protein
VYRLRTAVVLALIGTAALVCYWRPLTSPDASIVWDAADQFHPYQSYISSELHAGRLPFWTPYLLSGYPLLADPQAGAWYPLNWPFFAAGIVPRSIVVEQFLHVLLACSGAFLLGRRLGLDAIAAAMTSLTFGLSGFFVAHTSHTPMLQAAAWLPWLLLVFDRGLDGPRLRAAAIGGVVAGAVILAGHFQTALYSFFARALYAAGRAARHRPLWVRGPARVVAIVAIGTALAAVAVGPGLELTALSVRTRVDAIAHTEGMLSVATLRTLLEPDT